MIGTMLIVFGRLPATAGLNYTSPAPATWQTCLEPPPLLGEGILLARARRTQREQTSHDMTCCVQCATQAWDLPYRLESDLPYRRSGGCSSGRPPAGGCSSAVPIYPAAPSGVLLWLTNRQLRLFCTGVWKSGSFRVASEGPNVLPHTTQGRPASHTPPHRAQQSQTHTHTVRKPLTGYSTPRANECDSDSDTSGDSVEQISANTGSRLGNDAAQCVKNTVSCSATVLHTVNNRIASADQSGRPSIAELGLDPAERKTEDEIRNKRSPRSRGMDEGFTLGGENSVFSDQIFSTTLVLTPDTGIDTPRNKVINSGRETYLNWVVKISVHTLHRSAHLTNHQEGNGACFYTAVLNTVYNTYYTHPTKESTPKKKARYEGRETCMKSLEELSTSLLSQEAPSQHQSNRSSVGGYITPEYITLTRIEMHIGHTTYYAHVMTGQTKTKRSSHVLRAEQTKEYETCKMKINYTKINIINIHIKNIFSNYNRHPFVVPPRTTNHGRRLGKRRAHVNTKKKANLTSKVTSELLN